MKTICSHLFWILLLAAVTACGRVPPEVGPATPSGNLSARDAVTTQAAATQTANANSKTAAAPTTPTSSATPENAPEAALPTPEETFLEQECPAEYEVAAGDTLSRISRKCNINLETFFEVNPNFFDAKIEEGQQLFLPESNCDSPYTIQENDWIFRIARECGLSITEITRENPHLGMLRAGEVIRIPDAQQEPHSCSGEYIVQEGDYIRYLAFICGLSEQELIDHNDLENPDILWVDFPIKFP